MMEKIESGEDNVNFALVVHWNVLKEAVLATSEKRGSTEEITEYKEIVDEMRESHFLKRMREKYQEENIYCEED